MIKVRYPSRVIEDDGTLLRHLPVSIFFKNIFNADDFMSAVRSWHCGYAGGLGAPSHWSTWATHYPPEDSSGWCGYLAETWARFLDPYWVVAKQQVRARFASAESQSYISVAEIMRHLEQDLLRRDQIRATMCDALEASKEMGVRSHVSDRVAVAFVSPGRLLN